MLESVHVRDVRNTHRSCGLGKHLCRVHRRWVGARFTAPSPAAQIVEAWLGGTPLSLDERVQLDRFGNKDGTFNLGDLLALLDRTGENVSPGIIDAVVRSASARAKQPSSRTVKP